MNHTGGMKRLALGAAVIAALTSCGGNGGSGGQVTASGVAAVGAPIVNGTVSLNCASGAKPTTVTDQEGKWSILMKQGDFPCAAKVTNGKRVTTDNTMVDAPTLYSIAEKPGTTNITPITDMIMALLSQFVTDTYDNGWSETADRERLQKAIGELEASKRKVLDTLNKLPGTMPGRPDPTSGVDPIAGMDPITTTFDAKVTDPYDRLLERFQAAMATLSTMGVNYRAVLDAAVHNKEVVNRAYTATTFTYPALTTINAAAAMKESQDRYVISIPDPLRGIRTANIVGFDPHGNAAEVAPGGDFAHVVSFAGNRIGVLCVDKQGHMDETRKSLYAYVHSDVTEVTDVTELYGRTFAEYEDCMRPSGSLVITSTGEATFTEWSGESDPTDPADKFRAIFSAQGAVDGNAKVFGKAYKYTANGVTSYFYIVVSSETPFNDADANQDNYVILGVSN